MKPELALVVLLTQFFTVNAWAGGLEISPLKVNLDKQKTIQSITLRNIAEEEVLVRLKVYSWQQKDNKNIYEPTKDMLVTPPIVKVAGKSQQVVRLALRKAVTAKHEEAYRLYAEEVIPKAALKDNQLNFALRLGIPVFIAPENAVEPNLTWDIKQINAKTLKVVATNTGSQHVTVNKLELKPKVPTNWQIDKDIFNYVLPNSSHTWTFSLDKNFKHKEQLKLTANTSLGQLTKISPFKTS